MTPHSFRRTKILATLGPATDAPGVLEAVLLAGVNVVRLNFSHGTAEHHAARAEAVRAAASRLGREIGILADFIVLSGDPLSVYTHVEQTWVDGSKVFDLSNPQDREYAVGAYGINRGSSATHMEIH